MWSPRSRASSGALGAGLATGTLGTRPGAESWAWGREQNPRYGEPGLGAGPAASTRHVGPGAEPGIKPAASPTPLVPTPMAGSVEGLEGTAGAFLPTARLTEEMDPINLILIAYYFLFPS